MATSWRCPLPDCPHAVTESVPLIEALVTAYARAHQGELPEPQALSRLRHDRVAELLAQHIRGHGQRAVAAWISGGRHTGKV